MDEETERAINEALNIVQQSQQEQVSLRLPVEIHTTHKGRNQPHRHPPIRKQPRANRQYSTSGTGSYGQEASYC